MTHHSGWELAESFEKNLVSLCADDFRWCQVFAHGFRWAVEGGDPSFFEQHRKLVGPRNKGLTSYGRAEYNEEALSPKAVLETSCVGEDLFCGTRSAYG